MATLRNKRKLAAVARETSESTRNSSSQNTIDPDLAQDYVSHVSEEIEEGVTKKLSKEFGRTESRIFGALSKLDKFLLSPQVRTCSVAVPGTSGNSNSENREPTGDCSIDDPYPEVIFSSNLSGKLNNPGMEDYPLNKLILAEIFFVLHLSNFCQRNLQLMFIENYTSSNITAIEWYSTNLKHKPEQ